MDVAQLPLNLCSQIARRRVERALDGGNGEGKPFDDECGEARGRCRGR
jgi:hypothetical protein